MDYSVRHYRRGGRSRTSALRLRYVATQSRKARTGKRDCRHFRGKGAFFMIGNRNVEDVGLNGNQEAWNESVLRDSATAEMKRGLLWTFKKGGRFAFDQMTITVVDIVDKRVTL